MDVFTAGTCPAQNTKYSTVRGGYRNADYWAGAGPRLRLTVLTGALPREIPLRCGSTDIGDRIIAATPGYYFERTTGIVHSRDALGSGADHIHEISQGSEVDGRDDYDRCDQTYLRLPPQAANPLCATTSADKEPFTSTSLRK